MGAGADNETSESTMRAEGESVRGELPLSDFQKTLEQCVGKLGGRVKHCGRSAFHHLRRAWALYGVDNEMSAFRAITAEEEAASALILSLQQKRYPGAKRLNFRDHVHKAALTPFLDAVAKVLALLDFAKPTLRLKPDEDPPRLEVFVDMSRAGLRSPEPLFAQPDEPLNFVVRMENEDGPATVHMFAHELRQIAEGRGVDTIKAFLEAEANQRNRLLYATDTGIPQVSFEEGFLLERLRRVTVLLTLTIAIQQTPQHQLFAVQCVEAFLRALERMAGDGYDFGSLIQEPTSGIVVRKAHDKEPVTMFRRSYTFSATPRFRISPMFQVMLNIAEGSTSYEVLPVLNVIMVFASTGRTALALPV